ncbi:hypothetical protein ACIBQ1_36045 [Nonomuraea sp. NPDC050153]
MPQDQGLIAGISGSFEIDEIAEILKVVVRLAWMANDEEVEAA